MPFPEVIIQDFLTQAATNSLRFNNTASITTSSLQTDDSMRNSLLFLAHQLHQAKPLHATIQTQSPSPMVQPLTI